MEAKKVLVTGANGYIASWLVQMLLEKGYIVHATVRDKDNHKKVAHLESMAKQFPGQLALFNADLLCENDFNEPMRGCSVVFHTASPFLSEGIDDPQKQIIEPAIRGTESVLHSVNKTESVKRVVLTSSVVAVYSDYAELKGCKSGAFNEENWNESATPGTQPYPFSKVVAERSAWRIQQNQQRWDMVVLNPGLVIGPSLSPHSKSASLSTISKLIDGSFSVGVPKLSFPIVDVRDVALSHLLAAENKAATGRHILVAKAFSLIEMAQTLKHHSIGKYLKLPSRSIPKFIVWLVAPMIGLTRRYVSRNIGHPIEIDNSKSRRRLGIEYTSPETSLIEHVQAILDNEGSSK